MPSEVQRAVSCPRCGHEVAGVVTSWTESCPVHGRCPECGLDYQWGEVLAGALSHPRWSIEGWASVAGLVGRAIAQYVIAGVGVVWMARTLRMEHMIRWRRLAAATGASLAITWLVLVTMVFLSVRSVGVPAGMAAAIAVDPTQWSISGAARPPVARPGELLRVDFGSADTKDRDAFVRLRSIDPAGLDFDPYGLPQLPVFGPGPALAPGPPFLFVSHMSGPVLVESLPAGVQPTFALQRLHGRTTWLQWRLPFEARPILVGPLVGALLAGALVFAILPIARRRAKVRWRHIGRLAFHAAIGACSYAVIGLVLFSRFGQSFERIGRRLDITPSEDDPLVGAIVTFVVVPAIVASIWWWAAARWYLRMSRPMAVGLAVGCTAAVVVGLPSLFLVFEEIK